MLLNILSSIAAYIELTVTGPFRILAECCCSEKRAHSKRARKDSSARPFSLLELLQKHKQMSSHNLPEYIRQGSPRDYYVRETYVKPVSSSWVH